MSQHLASVAAPQLPQSLTGAGEEGGCKDQSFAWEHGCLIECILWWRASGTLASYWKKMVSQALRRSAATPWSEARVIPSRDGVYMGRWKPYMHSSNIRLALSPSLCPADLKDLKA